MPKPPPTYNHLFLTQAESDKLFHASQSRDDMGVALRNIFAKDNAALLSRMFKRGFDHHHTLSGAFKSLLYAAVVFGATKIVKLLVSKGVDLEIGANDHHTPLFQAAYSGYKNIATTLIDAGAHIPPPHSEHCHLFASICHHQKGHSNEILVALFDRLAAQKSMFFQSDAGDKLLNFLIHQERHKVLQHMCERLEDTISLDRIQNHIHRTPQRHMNPLLTQINQAITHKKTLLKEREQLQSEIQPHHIHSSSVQPGAYKL